MLSTLKHFRKKLLKTHGILSLSIRRFGQRGGDSWRQNWPELMYNKNAENQLRFRGKNFVCIFWLSYMINFNFTYASTDIVVRFLHRWSTYRMHTPCRSKTTFRYDRSAPRSAPFCRCYSVRFHSKACTWGAAHCGATWKRPPRPGRWHRSIADLRWRIYPTRAHTERLRRFWPDFRSMPISCPMWCRTLPPCTSWPAIFQIVLLLKLETKLIFMVPKFYL